MAGNNSTSSTILHNHFINNPEWTNMVYGQVKKSVVSAASAQEIEGFLKLHNGSYTEHSDLYPWQLSDQHKSLYNELKKTFSSESNDLVLTKFDIQSETGHHIAFELYSPENDFHNYIVFYKGGSYNNPGDDWGIVEDISMQGNNFDLAQPTRLSIDFGHGYLEFLETLHSASSSDVSE